MEYLGKNPRILWIYTQLIQGYTLSRIELAKKYGVSEKSIHRDMEDLQKFFSEYETKYSLQYDKKNKTYTAQCTEDDRLSAKEIVPVLKTVFESGTMLPERMFHILQRVAKLASSEQDRKMVQKFLEQEEECYQAPLYQKIVGEMLCQAEEAVWRKQWVKIRYCRKEESDEIETIVLPQAVIMREKRFFLAAQTYEGTKHNSVSLYRLDRISFMEDAFPAQPRQILNQKQLRQKIVSLTAGDEYEISFLYHGDSLKLIEEKLPHAIYTPQPDGWQVTVRVYGKGIGAWLRSMGKKVSNITATKVSELP